MPQRKQKGRRCLHCGSPTPMVREDACWRCIICGRRVRRSATDAQCWRQWRIDAQANAMDSMVGAIERGGCREVIPIDWRVYEAWAKRTRNNTSARPTRPVTVTSTGGNTLLETIDPPPEWVAEQLGKTRDDPKAEAEVYIAELDHETELGAAQ